MPWLELILFGIIQGVAEFLPISSSTHLQFFDVLWAEWFGRIPLSGQQMQLLLLCLHLGTLLALVIYLSQDLKQGLGSVFGDLCRLKVPRALVVWAIALTPMLILGAPIKWLVNQLHFGFLPQGLALIFLGWFLYWADQRSKKPHISSKKPVDKIPLTHACVIGIGQAMAMFPGASRLGMTIAMARFLGYDRNFSVYFSFYLAIPTMIIGMGYEAHDLWEHSTIPLQFFYECCLSGMVAFIVGLVTIHFLVQWVQRHSFLPFVIYRMIFGTILISWYLVFTH